MSPVKRYFLKFLVIYAVLAVLGIWQFGPPGFTREFRTQYGDEHSRYIEITKSPEYKRWYQRPDVAELDRSLQEFVQRFEALPEYEQEMRRRGWFELYMGLLNAIGLVLIAVRFGKRPLINFIDDQITQVKARIERARNARQTAESKLAEAKAKIDQLDAEKGRIAEQAEGAAARAVDEFDAVTELIVEHIAEEERIRKELELRHAALQIRIELADRALALAEKQIKETHTPERETALIDEFLRGLEEAG